MFHELIEHPAFNNFMFDYKFRRRNLHSLAYEYDEDIGNKNVCNIIISLNILAIGLLR